MESLMQAKIDRLHEARSQLVDYTRILQVVSWYTQLLAILLIILQGFSASLRLGRHLTCGARNSTTNYATVLLGQHPTHAELEAPRIMRHWFSASLRLGRHPRCGAGNSTTDYAMLVFSVAPLRSAWADISHVELAIAPRIMLLWFSASLLLGRHPTHAPNTCGASSTMDYAKLVFSVAPPWPTSHMWSWQQHHGLCDAGFQPRSALAIAQHMWSWQQHHGLCEAGFQRRSALAEAQHMWSWRQHHGLCDQDYATLVFSVALPWSTSHATTPRIIGLCSASFSVVCLGRHPTHVELDSLF
jgi:hypothetical protein